MGVIICKFWSRKEEERRRTNKEDERRRLQRTKMMSFCLSVPQLPTTSKTLVVPSTSASSTADISHLSCRCSLVPSSVFGSRRDTIRRRRGHMQVICMAPEEEKLTRRNPLDFPIVSALPHCLSLSISPFIKFCNYCNVSVDFGIINCLIHVGDVGV